MTSAYNEEECITELARRLRTVFAELDRYDFDVIAVENGSTDATFARLQEIREEDCRFKIVRLARNFRMDGGITAGLEFADGDAVVLMAADLQDPPELIRDFVTRWEEGFENVYAMVQSRGGSGVLRRLNSRLFYWTLGKLSDQPIPRNASDFRLLDRKVYEQVRQMDERNRFIRGLVAWVGFRSIGVPFERPRRFAGKSKAYTFQVFELATRALFAHSLAPLMILPLLGSLLVVGSFVALVALVFNWVLRGVPFPGFGTIVAVMVLLVGGIFLFLSLIAIYVGLTYEEVRRRPNFVVRETIGV